MLASAIKVISKRPLEAIFLFILFVFSALVMFKTFSAPDGNLKIATKVWSDFAATIPLIRSFSKGANFPPQYPIFPGPPIRYHFVFFFLVGMLEKLGLRIDWALNSLSIISFFALTLAIYFLAKEVFKKKSVAILSVILFLFNGSFSFLEFFKAHPLSAHTIGEIISHPEFSSFGPYDGKVVSAFWSLNIFTNQRHLALGYGAFLGLVLIIYKASKSPKYLTTAKCALLGLLLGLFPFIHSAVFGMMGIALVIFFFVYPSLRPKIFTIGGVALVLGLPQILYMGAAQVKFSYINPGYLVDNLSLKNFLIYWLFNLGLAIFLAPLGFLFSKKGQRKIFLPFAALFVVGNIFQFTPDMPTNHKFFNLFIIGANLSIAYFLIRFWEKGLLSKLTVAILLFFLILSGIIDFFPIINDGHLEIKDIPKNNVVSYIVKKTPKDSVFLNSSFLYDPASIAGRKIYLGWPYFSWSAGYDTDKRFKTFQEILLGKDKKTICKTLIAEGIDFIEIKNPSDLEGAIVNYTFFERNFNKIFSDDKDGLSIYDVSRSCRA